MRTGFASLKLAAAGFVIPYIFVYSPEILMRDVAFFEGIAVIITALAGIFLLSTALEQHFMVNMSWYLAILVAAGAILLLNSDMLFSAIGAGIGVLVLAVQMYKAKQQGRLRFSVI